MTVRSPLVLCYHATSETWEHSLSIPPAMVARQLSWLLRLYRPASLADVLAGARGSVHVTFDDAFRSITGVVPTLRELGMPATVFACSEYADDGKPLAVPELADEARAHPAELATMAWDDLRELAEAGIEVGSHTVTHAHLVDLPDTELERELRESRVRIEDELGAPCRYLAYPFGESDRRVRAAATAAGYRAAFALRADRRRDTFAFPRLGLWRHDRIRRGMAKVALRRDLGPETLDEGAGRGPAT
jgi:peptidoglycan/xylan/chitin deacetylase (PgdA/CDA1 family)